MWNGEELLFGSAEFGSNEAHFQHSGTILSTEAFEVLCLKSTNPSKAQKKGAKLVKHTDHKLAKQLS